MEVEALKTRKNYLFVQLQNYDIEDLFCFI